MKTTKMEVVLVSIYSFGMWCLLISNELHAKNHLKQLNMKNKLDLFCFLTRKSQNKFSQSGSITRIQVTIEYKSFYHSYCDFITNIKFYVSKYTNVHDPLNHHFPPMKIMIQTDLYFCIFDSCPNPANFRLNPGCQTLSDLAG